MFFSLPVNHVTNCPDPNLGIGVEREVAWHKSVIKTYIKQNSCSGTFYAIGHCVKVLSLSIPGLNALIYYTTYFALSHLHPQHLGETYQLALDQRNIGGAKICLDRGANKNQITSDGKNILDLLSEEIAKKAYQNHLDQAYALIENGIEIRNVGTFAKRRLFYWACTQKKLTVMRALMEAGVTFTNWKEACDYVKLPPVAKLKPIIPEKLTSCLTDLSIATLSPFACRKVELRKLFRILQNRKKRTPIVVGKSGVGKTALIQGFAQMLQHNESFPEVMRKRVIRFDIPAYSNSNEPGITEAIIAFLKKNQGTFILFLDDVHLLLPSKEAYQKNPGNLLNLFLRYSPCIFTIHEKYAAQIRGYPQVAEHGEFLELEPPSSKETLAIFLVAKRAIEEHYNVMINETALREVLFLCSSFLPNHPQPQIGIEILENAAKHLASQQTEGPFPLQKARSELEKLELQHLVHPLSKHDKKLTELKKEIERLEGKMVTFQECFKEQEKQKFLKAVNQLEEENVSSFQELITASEKRILALNEQLGFEFKMTNTVDVEAVQAVVSKISKIPHNRLSEEHRVILLNAKSFLKERVIGQSQAVQTVAKTIQKAGAQLTTNRPLGSFLFVGPSGTGKTELGKTIAELFFGSRSAIYFISMGQYQEQHTVSNLTGVPPGYVGAESEGKLTQALRKNPRQVIVFDEAEKAHPSFWDLLLTVCDEGFYKDTSTGEKVDCRHLFIVLTSNAGSKEFLSQVAEIHLKAEKQNTRNEPQKSAMEGLFSPWNSSTSVTEENPIDTEEEIKRLCKLQNFEKIFLTEIYKVFRPEFLGRLTVIPFLPIHDQKIIRRIALKHLITEQQFFAQSRYQLQMEWTNTFVTDLVMMGGDLASGVRPIRNFLEDTVRGEVSYQILQKKIQNGNKIKYCHISKGKPTVRVV